ncbi:MAG: hypothetical protein JWM83_2536 [Candidatus Angelobacter sp.]|nr:hypothetical protein [Candidatus Angelobacter sp.]
MELLKLLILKYLPIEGLSVLLQPQKINLVLWKTLIKLSFTGETETPSSGEQIQLLGNLLAKRCAA